MQRFTATMMLIVLLWPLAAHAAEPLFIGQARVDVMGESPEKARDAAVKQAKRDALADLCTKFAPSQKSLLMESLTDKKIDEMVRGVKFVNEHADGNRFRAEAQVSVSAEAFNKLVADQITAIESDEDLVTTSSLILPVFETAERTLLFEKKNLWGEEWKGVARNVGRGQLITPYGDSVDYSMLNARDAATSEFHDFAPLLRRYGVRDVIILRAKLIKSDMVGNNLEDPKAKKKPNILEIEERRVQSFQDEIKTFEYVADSKETDRELYARAARDLSIYIIKMQKDTVSNVAARKRQLQSIMAVVPITTMQHFNWLREKLSKVAGVELLEVLAIKPRQADLRIHYSGESTVLVDAMKTAGLNVEAHENYLEIRP